MPPLAHSPAPDALLRQGIWRGLALGLAMVVQAGSALGVAPAKAEDLGTADKVRAAYLYNFTKFTRWPATAFTDPASPIVLCSWAGPAFDGFLSALVLGRHGQDGRTLQVISTPPQRSDCHLVYQPVATPAAPSKTQACACLVVGEADAPDPAQALTFQVRDRRLRFSVDQTALAGSGVGLSAELLALAVPAPNSTTTQATTEPAP